MDSLGKIVFCIWLFVLLPYGPKAQSEPSVVATGNFHERSWGFTDGLGAVFDIQQAPDGYIWLTTSKGVLRFDGVRFQTISEVSYGALRNDRIISLTVANNGILWLTTRNDGLEVIEHGKLIEYPYQRRCVSVALTDGMTEDADGSFWSRSFSGLYSLKGGSCKQIGPVEGYPGGYPAAILVDRSGVTWIKTPSGALVARRSDEGRFELYGNISGPSSEPAFLHQAPDGSVWISDEDGLRRVNSHSEPRKRTFFGDFTFASDGSLYAAESDSVHVYPPSEWTRADRLAPSPTSLIYSGPRHDCPLISKMFIDRENNIWLGTSAGLTQLRKVPLHRVPLQSNESHQFAIAPGTHRSVWVGNKVTPLTRIDKDGRTIVFPRIRQITCIRRGNGETIWAAGDDRQHLWKFNGKTFTSIRYPSEETVRIVSMAVDRNNDLWINTRTGPTYRLTKSGWHLENKSLNKRPNMIGEMASDGSGNIWFEFDQNVVRWDGQSFEAFPFAHSPMDISAIAMAIRDDRVWLSAHLEPCGRP